MTLEREASYMYADCPTERVVEKKVEVQVEKKVQVPVEVPRPRPLSDDTGCQTTGIWCSYCGAPGHTKANCPLLAALKRIKDYLPGVQTDPSCQLCARFGHFAPQCPLLAQLILGPIRFKQMEEERRNLSERISNGQGKAPSQGPRGFIIGTFVQGAGMAGLKLEVEGLFPGRPPAGSHDRHRLSSDTGPRTMYRVYRSGISTDSAMDTDTLEKIEKMPGCESIGG
eukprot:Skav236176  [mRNA]  locus=scaffold298:465672:487352:- [translate_table: standard]